MGGGSDQADEAQAMAGGGEETPTLRATLWVTRAEGLERGSVALPGGSGCPLWGGGGTGSVRHSTGIQKGSFTELSTRACGQGLEGPSQRVQAE